MLYILYSYSLLEIDFDIYGDRGRYGMGLVDWWIGGLGLCLNIKIIRYVGMLVCWFVGLKCKLIIYISILYTFILYINTITNVYVVKYPSMYTIVI